MNRERFFTLQLDWIRGREYRVQRSEGAKGRGDFAFPFTDEEMRLMRQGLEAALFRSLDSRTQRDRHGRPSLQRAARWHPLKAREIGARLGAALFPGEVNQRFREERAVAGDQNLRCRLSLALDPTVSAMARLLTLPWELVTNPLDDDFLLPDSRCPLIRSLQVQWPYSPPPPTAGPLNLLIVTAQPKGTHALSAEEEIGRIRAACRDEGGIRIQVLHHATPESLRPELERADLVHFIGHGLVNRSTGEGILVLEGEDGRRIDLGAEEFARLCRDLPGLRLLTLNACDTAAVRGEDLHLNPFASVATALIQQGVPAVIAMQWPLTDRAGIRFGEALYRHIAREGDLLNGVEAGRHAIRVASRGTLEWATPVLYLHNQAEVQLLEPRPEPIVVPTAPERLSFRQRAQEFLSILRSSYLKTPAAILGSVALLGAGYLAQSFLPAPELPNALRWLPLGLLLTGLGLWLYLFLRIRRDWRSQRQETEFRPGPAAIKGAASFAPDDAELFSRLSRQEELAQLRSWILDDQVPVVVVLGDSGAGKTSFVRAGLEYLARHQKEDEAIRIAYWEANPEDAWGRFLKATRTQLNVENPTSLEAAVLVVDQAEQLSLSQNADFFGELQRTMESTPPFAATWIVAMRREFHGEWMDFLLRLPERYGHRVRTLSIREFDQDQAKSVFRTLLREADLEVLGSIEEDLIPEIARQGRVSPVDLGITLQVLARNPNLATDLTTVGATGGHAALLTAYLESVLEPYSQAQRDEIFRALFTLVDEDKDRRLPEGRTLKEIRKSVEPASPRYLDLALQGLAQPRVRVLEAMGTAAFRLIHERFIPAIRRLAGKLLDEAEQASRLLARRYRLWEEGDRRGRLLLVGRDLGMVLKHRGLLRWGDHPEGKADFLAHSKRRRNLWRASRAAIAALILLGVTGYETYREEEHTRKALLALGLPQGTYELLPRITSLDVAAIPISDIRWLESATSLRELSIKFSRQSTDDDLERLPDQIATLDLYLAYSQIENLGKMPRDISSLTLHLGESKVTTLRGLPGELSSLTLYLNRSEVGDFENLPEKLSSLTLNLRRRQVRSFRDLPRGLSDLNLLLFGSKVQELRGLPRNLKTLHLVLSSSQIKTLEGIPPGLSLLTLHLNSSTVKDFSALPDTTSSLDLYLGASEPKELTTLPPYTSSLSLIVTTSEVEHLQNLPPRVSSLKLDLQGPPVESLRQLPRGISNLTLRMRHDVPQLPELPADLSSLTLNLFSSELRSLPGFSNQLSSLTLQLQGSHVQELPSLPDNLSSLVLLLSGTQIRSLPQLPSHLHSLDLRTRGSKIDRLPSLPPRILSLALRPSDPQLSDISFPAGLSILSLNLIGSQSQRLPELPQGVHSLTLDLRESTIGSLLGVPRTVRFLDLTLGTSQARSFSFEGLPDELAELRLTVKNNRS